MHVPRRDVDRRRLRDAAVAGRDRIWSWAGGVAAAEEQETGRNERRLRPVPARKVEQRLVARAEAALLAGRARELDGAWHEHRLQRGQLLGGGSHGEHRSRAIGRTAVQEVVVNLHHDLAPRRERHAGSVGQPVPAPPRSPGGDPVGVVQRALDAAHRRRARRETGAAEAAPTLAGAARVELSRLGDLRPRDAEEDHVMDDLARAGLDPRRRDGHVARGVRVEEETAVVVGRALRRARLVCGRHAHVENGLAGAGRRRRRRERLSRRPVDPRSRAHPPDDRGALARGQPALRSRT